MRIDYLAHACFLVTGDSGVRVVFDPYDAGHYGDSFHHAPPAVDADLVFTSHAHADHSAVGEIGGAPLAIDGPSAGSERGVSWQGLGAFHDDCEGAQRGPITIFRLEIDGLALCHAGDLGEELAASEAALLGRVDVLLAPIGGHFSIDAAGAVTLGRTLRPRVLVPMHFKTPKIGFPIAPPDEFLRLSPWPVKRKGNSMTFASADLPASTEVWFMEPSR